MSCTPQLPKHYLKELISQDEGHHGFHHRHCPGDNTGIVAPPRKEIHILTVAADRVLLLGDCRGRLEGDLDDNVLPV